MKNPEELLNFAPRAQQVLALAHAEADRHQQPRTGTEHLLAALLQLEPGIVGSTLNRMGVHLDPVREQIEAIDRLGSGAPPDDISFYTERANRALRQTVREAQKLNQTLAGPEHIFLALLHDPDATAPRILQRLQVDVPSCRREFLRELALRPPQPEPPAADRPEPGEEKTADRYGAKLIGLLAKLAHPRRHESNTVKDLRLFDEKLTGFTPRLKQVLRVAHEEADRLDHPFIGTEHLLLGLSRFRQGRRVNLLERLGLDPDQVRHEVEKDLVRGTRKNPPHGAVAYTPRVKQVLRLAAQEAKASNHTYLGTEHLLLGFLIEGDGVAGRVLRRLGLSPAACHQAIRGELDPGGKSGPSP